MRQLRFVRPTEDASHLVVATVDGSEHFALPLDPALRAVLTTAPEPTPAAVEPAASVPAGPPAELGPREIQVRIRAGESPQKLADSFGVPLERVMRFAGPVVEERSRIADESRRARARCTVPDGTESKVVIFGEAVDARFAAYGISPADVRWDARRRDDGDWVVQAQWTGADDTHRAEWVFVRTARSMTAIDDTASDLLSERPIRPVAPPVPERLSLASAPRLVPGVVAFPPMPDAHTGPLPRYDGFFDQNAAPEGPRDLPPFLPAEAEAELQFEAPPLPLGITDPSTRPGAAVSTLTNIHRAKRDESEDDRAARSRIPSWDDILLGVRRKQD